MTVAQLIAFLQRQPQHLPVVYECYSEQVLLKEEELQIKELCLPRPDGWVQNFRDDMSTQAYLVLPGN